MAPEGMNWREKKFKGIKVVKSSHHKDNYKIQVLQEEDAITWSKDREKNDWP